MNKAIISAISDGRSVLLADGGSTKMEWLLLSGGKAVWHHVEPGVNPLTQGVEGLSGVFRRIADMLPEKPEASGYYGAGCVPAVSCAVEKCMEQTFGCTAQCGSDLLLAAGLLCPENEGIVCILGTGSNSGFFCNGEMKSHRPSLGYILGDEGGAAYMGRRIVADCLRGLPDDVAIKQWESLMLSEEEVITRLYRSRSGQAAFLGEIFRLMAPAIQKSDYLQHVVKDCLDAFLSGIADFYKPAPGTDIFFVGSIGSHFASLLKNLSLRHGFTFRKAVGNPLSKYTDPEI